MRIPKSRFFFIPSKMEVGFNQKKLLNRNWKHWAIIFQKHLLLAGEIKLYLLVQTYKNMPTFKINWIWSKWSKNGSFCSFFQKVGNKTIRLENWFTDLKIFNTCRWINVHGVTKSIFAIYHHPKWILGFKTVFLKWQTNAEFCKIEQKYHKQHFCFDIICQLRGL